LLIAGKGHENYQEINGEQFYFDDLVEVKKYFNLLKK
jgi:UDP-N-acetylmuramoyl-L-alanyl-D-glutamate--2,6-diaminopimelate ligase